MSFNRPCKQLGGESAPYESKDGDDYLASSLNLPDPTHRQTTVPSSTELLPYRRKAGMKVNVGIFVENQCRRFDRCLEKMASWLG